MSRGINTDNRQSGCRNMTCHILSVVVRHQHVSKGFGEGESGGPSDIKSLPAVTAPDAGFPLNSD